MNRLPKLIPHPVPAWQQDRLRHWLAEWTLDQPLRAENATPAPGAPPPPAVATEPAPVPGQIRLLAPADTPAADRPVYVAVLRIAAPDRFVVAPFGRFAEPATPGEWLTRRPQPPLRVLCLWNARPVAAATLTRSWLVDHLTPAELQNALAVFDYQTAHTALPEPLALQLGPPLVHPLDPRHEYLEEERAALEMLPLAADSAEVLRYPAPPAALALAAETPTPYGGASTWQVANTDCRLVVTPLPDAAGASVRATDPAGQPTTALDGCVLRFPDGTVSPPIRAGQTTISSAALPPATVLVTSRGTTLHLRRPS